MTILYIILYIIGSILSYYMIKGRITKQYVEDGAWAGAPYWTRSDKFFTILISLFSWCIPILFFIWTIFNHDWWDEEIKA